MDLCASRQMVHGVGYIPWDSLNTWATRHTINDSDQFELLRYVVSKMDEFWVEHFKGKK